jgi:toxin-antitoxin system PIN domain toxin
MQIPDVNVLLSAYYEELPGHSAARKWLDQAVTGDEGLGLADIVLNGFIRIGTDTRVFQRPLTLVQAFDYCEEITGAASVVAIHPGASHWATYRRLAVARRAVRGGLTDAYLAALALENDSSMVTFDRGFGRFAGLRWTEPR